MDKQVGQPVDISSSAYQYRADRKAEENDPESWLLLMRYANQPLNKPLDVNALAIKQALCGLLWEEIRPVQQLELTWAADASRRPSTEELLITTLDNQGTASSWWNNIAGVQTAITPTISIDGKTYVYALQKATCGIVITVTGDRTASDYEVPKVRILTAETWKKMDVEIEWGFEEANAEKDYSGRLDAYDGMIAGLSHLDGDMGTCVKESSFWLSSVNRSERRGVRFSLLYTGVSKWRKQQSFTTYAEDAARTIVTVWTKSGNFSFLAADLENGPILAPEYGFFVRRTSEPAPEQADSTSVQPPTLNYLANKMDSIAGTKDLLGWGSDDCPWFGGNPADKPVSISGITVPAHSLAMHPGIAQEVAVGWRSPIKGVVLVKASVAHGQTAGDGIEWRLAHIKETDLNDMAHGATNGSGTQNALEIATVEPGDMISLIVGPKVTHHCDTTIIELIVSEDGGLGRVWNVTEDVLGTLHAGNPHADGHGNADVWHLYSESRKFSAEPPISLSSNAKSAREFIQELNARKLTTIRQQIRQHDEQTWEGAVTAMRGVNLPPHPTPPAGYEPTMRVEVPSERLTAQWNLGVWHLTRHCEKHPANGRLWFNDYPYGILAAETYLVLAVLDLMGSHKAAEDGFDQWVSLPMDPDSKGHHGWALPDRPNGLFTEGHGCLTHAVGPTGAGGHMDGVHAFGPGSIGYALTEHYWLTGDKEWLKASAPRIKANAEWMLRQRRFLKETLPGGERLWCKGLQPALQVTPDSGGLWMQFYECEGYYWAAVSRFASTLSEVDPGAGAQLAEEAEAYRKDLRAAVERSIALSPVVPVRDGTFHSVVPFACYVRGLSVGAWGWERDGSGVHVGPLYWDTVQSAAALISPAGLLSASDIRVQGYLDVLEDRLLLENANVGNRDWFDAGWQYQGGLERTANMHLDGDDVPVFLRSFLNCYAVDILPDSGYIFNEHAVHGPPDKIFEEAAFLERFRNMLVMEDEKNLWLCRALPRAWLEQGKKISVTNAPTHFGTTSYEVVSDVDNGRITVTIEMPSRSLPKAVILRLRHPKSTPLKNVRVNGVDWKDFDISKQAVHLHDLTGTVKVEAFYGP